MKPLPLSPKYPSLLHHRPPQRYKRLVFKVSFSSPLVSPSHLPATECFRKQQVGHWVNESNCLLKVWGTKPWPRSEKALQEWDLRFLNWVELGQKEMNKRKEELGQKLAKMGNLSPPLMYLLHSHSTTHPVLLPPDVGRISLIKQFSNTSWEFYALTQYMIQ